MFIDTIDRCIEILHFTIFRIQMQWCNFDGKFEVLIYTRRQTILKLTSPKEIDMTKSGEIDSPLAGEIH